MWPISLLFFSQKFLFFLLTVSSFLTFSITIFRITWYTTTFQITHFLFSCGVSGHNVLCSTDNYLEIVINLHSWHTSILYVTLWSTTLNNYLIPSNIFKLHLLWVLYLLTKAVFVKPLNYAQVCSTTVNQNKFI